jgi:hypothetical protein
MGNRSLLVVAVVATATTLGCDGGTAAKPTGRPVAAGTVERVSIWHKPVQRPGEMGENTGNPQPRGSRVEVYDQFILVTPPGGPTLLALHGWYTDLEFRRD